jgi:malate dehydrogenase
MYKITVIGAGRVGEATAQLLAQQGLCEELVLLDRTEGNAVGTALDIQQSASLFRFDVRVRGGSSPALISGSDLVIVTAGFPRRPGMSRMDVLETNIPIIDEIVGHVVEYAPGAMLLMVTNPVDVLTFRAWQITGWDRSRVLGQAGVLDSARMASFVAMETGFSPQDVTALVIGGHGDAMVPLTRYTCVHGVPIDHFMDPEAIARVVHRTRHGGAEILSLRQKSSAYDSPAAAIVTMVDAIRHNRRRLMPALCVLEGEYGISDVAMGVPVVLGGAGISRVVELKLEPGEHAILDASAQGMRDVLTRLPGRQTRETRFEERARVTKGEVF